MTRTLASVRASGVFERQESISLVSDALDKQIQRLDEEIFVLRKQKPRDSCEEKKFVQNGDVFRLMREAEEKEKEMDFNLSQIKKQMEEVKHEIRKCVYLKRKLEKNVETLSNSIDYQQSTLRVDLSPDALAEHSKEMLRQTGIMRDRTETRELSNATSVRLQSSVLANHQPIDDEYAKKVLLRHIERLEREYPSDIECQERIQQQIQRELESKLEIIEKSTSEFVIYSERINAELDKEIKESSERSYAALLKREASELLSQINTMTPTPSIRKL